MRLAPGLARLLATCAALSLALAPHVAHLPAWVSAAFAGAVLWRLAAEHRGWALPPRALRLAAALVAVVGVLASYRTINGLDAGTALLALMAGLKLSETRAPRDHAVLVFIGYFLCLATLLYGESFTRFAFTLLAAWLLTAALARVHRPVGAETPVRPLRLAARAVALGLPLAVVLFLFVPRIEGRLWAIPAPTDRHSSGIDEEMSPGDIAALGLSDEPAFRVWFEGALPPPAERYFRVLALESFDGRRWRRAGGDGRPAEIDAGARRYAYRIALEPTGREWLPGLDLVVSWPRAIIARGRAGQLVYAEPRQGERRPVTSRLNYELVSSPDAVSMASGLPDELARRDLELPPGAAPRARALAASLRGAASDDTDYLRRVLDRFRREDYSYTLAPPPVRGDPVDGFLFDTRAGFCEHYAAAFTVLMRAAGIPSRVVVGYQGGEFNGFGGYLLVRQASAHAWSEVWLARRGWTRVDPTAAVDPARVDRDGPAPLYSSDAAPLYASLAWVGRLRSAWDAARTAWYERVVNFDPARQAQLLAALGLGARGWAGLALALTGGLALAALALAAWLGWELRPRRGDPLEAAWQRACAALARRGCPRDAAEGPADYARRAATRLPALAAPLAALSEAYVAARYLPGATAADRARCLALAARLTALARAA